MRYEKAKSNGYYVLFMPNYHKTHGIGYVYEHRYLMEQKLGRYLIKGEIIHHKDGDKLNNNINNLELFSSHTQHKVKHRRVYLTNKLPNEINIIIKCACGCGKEFLKYDNNGRLRKYAIGGCHRKINAKKYKKENIICSCGCGKSLNKYDKYGRIRKYIKGHNNKITWD